MFGPDLLSLCLCPLWGIRLWGPISVCLYKFSSLTFVKGFKPQYLSPRSHHHRYIEGFVRKRDQLRSTIVRKRVFYLVFQSCAVICIQQSTVVPVDNIPMFQVMSQVPLRIWCLCFRGSFILETWIVFFCIVRTRCDRIRVERSGICTLRYMVPRIRHNGNRLACCWTYAIPDQEAHQQ